MTNTMKNAEVTKAQTDGSPTSFEGVTRPTAPRTLTAERKRMRFLYAGMRCLRRLGFNATTMDEIAVEAGVKRITLYRQFGSRSELLNELIQHRFDAFNRRFLERSELNGDIAGLLEQYLLGSMRIAMRNPISRELVRGKLDFTAPGNALHTRARELWVPVMDAAKQAGTLNPELDIDAAIQWIMICQFTLCRMALEAAMDPDRARLLVRGFVAPAFARP